MEHLFRVYKLRNMGVRSVAKLCHEFGKTCCAEQSAAYSAGMTVAALDRQTSYLAVTQSKLESLAKEPIMDLPATHNESYIEVDLSEPFRTFVTGPEGKKQPINEDTRMMGDLWITLAAEMAMSQSAGQSGSLHPSDKARADALIAALSNRIAELVNRPAIDLPETADPFASMA